MSKYTGKDNYGNPKSDFLNKLSEMDDAELFNKTKDMIWFSAFASNNPHSDYHWQCDACYDECDKRGKLDIYRNAHKYISESV